MSLLYVNDSGATIGIEGNCCTVKQKDGSKRMLPIESLDGITIYKATMTSRNINPMETKSAIPFSQRITNEHLLNRCPFVISFFTFI